MARVYLKGLPQLKAKLVALKERTADEVRPALAASADEIVAMMRRLVPVDSGALRDSIGWTFGDKPRYAQALAVARAGDLVVTIFAGNSRVRYAHLVEFGARPHKAGGKFAGAEHPGAPAQPFFYPSYRALKRDAKRRIAKAVREAVKRAAA